MSYVDVWAAAVPIENKEKFTQMCQKVAPAFKDNGALMVLDCWEDDVPEGKQTSFHLAVDKKEGEAVSIGIIVWPDKATRDAGMPKTMSDPRMNSEEIHEIFEGARVIAGGFNPVSEVS